MKLLNLENTIKSKNNTFGETYYPEDLKLNYSELTIPDNINEFLNIGVEYHIYSTTGDLIYSNHDLVISKLRKQSILLNINELLYIPKIINGNYTIVFNFNKNILGSFKSKSFTIEEISPDNSEMKLRGNFTDEFKSIINELNTKQFLNNLLINFGYNNTSRISNLKFENGFLYVKLYTPLLEQNEKDLGWFDLEIFDTYIDNISVINTNDVNNTFTIGQPNFDIDANIYSGETTIFKNWEDVLSEDLPTKQNILDGILSGSGVDINIDYTSFDNFIFYSSAKERFENFWWKMENIEQFQSKSLILNETSNSFFRNNEIERNNKNIDKIKNTFDQWERWMYYSTNQTIFSYDITGSLQPFPKYISGSNSVLYSVKSETAKLWYTGSKDMAEIYDNGNNNRLYWAIPEHIVMDTSNDNYVTFIEMVAEYYDGLYSYIHGLTKIHERDEHPERGAPKALLPNIAESFGWQLQNSKGIEELWRYKTQQDQDGNDLQSDLYATTAENYTNQIWNRIVNNLPYLYKTKGTSRSIKALMSIYGIPQTLLNIREFGGPNNDPTLIQDKYTYGIQLNSGSKSIRIPRNIYPEYNSTSPDTIEFRFSTHYSSSVQELFSIRNNGTSSIKLEIVPTGSYNLHSNYGRFKISSLFNNVTSSIYSEYLPIYNDDFWTVRLYKEPSSYSVVGQFAQANDCLNGVITYEDNIRLNLGNYMTSSWNPTITGSYYNYLFNDFIGIIQSYKEYYSVNDNEIFLEHVKNPQAYYDTGVSQSYDTLYRYYPLGVDNNIIDFNTITYVSSSHPNQKWSLGTTSSFHNYNSASYVSINETYYIQTPTLGGNALYSKKIRIEDDILLKPLSNQQSVIKSKYDYSPNDSNKVHIVFSPSEQVNNDILNQLGNYELDEFIGDPQYEFEDNYNELRIIREKYYQKYQRRTNVNNFIRALSVYDYTFFTQLKQLIPARVNLIDGILIENDQLTRSKVQLSKKPTVENPQYETNIERETPIEAEYSDLSGSMNDPRTLSIAYSYLTGSLEHTLNVNIQHQYLTSSISHDVKVVMNADNYPSVNYQRSGLYVSMSMLSNGTYNGSTGVTESIIDIAYLRNCCYHKVNRHYSASGEFPNNYLRDWSTAVSMSYGLYYSSSLECFAYQYSEEPCAVENRIRFAGSKIYGAGVNIDSDDTLDKGPAVEIFEVSEDIDAIFVDNPSIGNLNIL